MTTCCKIHVQSVRCFSFFSSVVIFWDLEKKFDKKKRIRSDKKCPLCRTLESVKNHILTQIWNEIVNEVFEEAKFLWKNVLVNLFKHFFKSIFGINKFFPSLTGKVF